MNYRGRIAGSLYGMLQSALWMAIGYPETVLNRYPALGATCLFAAAGWWLGRSYDRAKFQAEKDALTKLYNRRFINTVFPKLRSLADRRQKKLGVLIIDINRFKQVNDTYGHKTGDQVLVELSRLLTDNMRSSDFVARWGGDEFVVLAPDMSADSMEAVAGRIKAKLQELPSLKKWRVGISLGTALYPDDAASLEELVHRADQRMYQFKLDR